MASGVKWGLLGVDVCHKAQEAVRSVCERDALPAAGLMACSYLDSLQRLTDGQ
jgi:hypothetical protein